MYISVLPARPFRKGIRPNVVTLFCNVCALWDALFNSHVINLALMSHDYSKPIGFPKA